MTARHLLQRAHDEESGQMAFAMVLTLLVVFMFFALAFDAGLWYFDHRTAQNQAEAAALAAVLELPATDTTTAAAKANEWLTRNGVDSCGADCSVTFTRRSGAAEGPYDTVRVSVSRSSEGLFSKLSGIEFVTISGAATATAGRVEVSNVMPWAVVAPDPTCTEEADRNCLYDANKDGDYSDPGDCNDSWQICPFGLTEDRLYAFKLGNGGNTGILRVCDNGADKYRDCLAGARSTGFFGVDDTVNVYVESGTMANATDTGLQGRQPAGAWALPGASTCDINSTPLVPSSASPGYDPDGKALAKAKFVNPTTNPQCAYRLVPIPIVNQLPPNGSADVRVLGIASFGVASWDRENGQRDFLGTADSPCRAVKSGGPKPTPADTDFPCGTVWGYLFTGVTPPDALLQQISDTGNPFAPILVALID